MRCLLGLLLFSLALIAQAEQVPTRIGFETGRASVRSADFYASTPWSLYSGLSFDKWGSDVYFENLGDFSSRHGEGSVSVLGSGMRVSRAVNIADVLTVYPAVGWFLWQAQARQFSHTIGNDNGASSVLQLSSNLSLLKVLSLDFFVRRYSNISGDSLAVMGLGLRYEAVLQ